MSKLIYVVIDGMGDVPIKELGNKTPLAVANTPNLGFLAENGKTGLMYTVGKGIAPESDAGVLSILGYNPHKYEASRGVLEAVGSGLVFEDGDLALRCNFATLSSNGVVLDRRAGRNLTEKEAADLSREINIKVKLISHPAKFRFKATFGHRGVLIIRGKGIFLSGRITNTDPAYTRVGGIGVVNNDAKMILQKSEPMDSIEAARISADLVNEFSEKSHRILDQSAVNQVRLTEHKLSANGVLSRDAGHSLPKFPAINKEYGVNFCCLADMPLEVGIAQLVGMHIVNLPRPSGDLIRDCEIRVRKLLGILNSYDCFYIHIKGPDEPGHDGNYRLKASMIEIIDRYFFGLLLQKINLEEHTLCITADHATPCTLKAHSDDPVPVLISGDTIKGDGNKKFSEESCSNGSLGLIEHGVELMPKLIKFL